MSWTIGCVKPISVTTDSTVVMWFTSSSPINSSSDLSSTAVLGDEPARLHLEEARTNGRKILVFVLWLATLPGKTGAPRFPPSLSSDLARLVADPLSLQIAHQFQTWRWDTALLSLRSEQRHLLAYEVPILQINSTGKVRYPVSR